MNRRIAPLFCIALAALSMAWSLALPTALFAQKPAARPAAVEAFLPPTFAGWQIATPQVSASPQQADAANAAVLQEYGFLAQESGTYERDGNTLTVHAMLFQDATGAYGAYTFYRREGMKPIEVGKQGAFDGAHILFWTNGVLCDAVFAHITAMSASDLREMADLLPKLHGGAGTAPSLPGFLPHAQLDSDTTRYAIGPVGYARGGGVLPPALIDFARGAEVITAQYSGVGGVGTLTLINYPTPQIAADRLNAINAYLHQHDPDATQALQQSSQSSIQTRRSGPLVVVVTGNFTAERAKALAGIVHYDADVTFNNPKGYVSESGKAARLLLGVSTLIVVLLGVTVLIGFFFGGGRVMLRKLRGKPTTSMEEVEFIKLNLD